MLVVIVANCIVMMLDNPLEPEGSDLNRAIKVLEYTFTALFFIEFTVKICCHLLALAAIRCMLARRRRCNITDADKKDKLHLRTN